MRFTTSQQFLRLTRANRGFVEGELDAPKRLAGESTICIRPADRRIRSADLAMPLQWGANNRPLRDELDKITDDYADSDERLGEQIDLVTRLALKYNASISLVRETKPGEPPFTCYQHSFSLVGVESIKRVMDENCITLDRQFIQYLVDTRLDEISIEDAKDGDHVLYIGSQIEHAGKVAQDAVESKWGKAHLWRHGIFEVPSRYGNMVRWFFRQIS